MSITLENVVIILVLSLIFFEMMKEFIIEYLNYDRKSKPKVKNMFVDQLLEYFHPVYMAFRNPRVLYAVLFFILHEFTIKTLVKSNDYHQFEIFHDKSLKYGFYFSIFYGLCYIIGKQIYINNSGSKNVTK